MSTLIGNLQRRHAECRHSNLVRINRGVFPQNSILQLRSSSSTTVKVRADPHNRDVIESTQESPVCSYNEWDPLEVIMYPCIHYV